MVEELKLFLLELIFTTDFGKARVIAFTSFTHHDTSLEKHQHPSGGRRRETNLGHQVHTRWWVNQIHIHGYFGLQMERGGQALGATMSNYHSYFGFIETTRKSTVENPMANQSTLQCRRTRPGKESRKSHKPYSTKSALSAAAARTRHHTKHTSYQEKQSRRTTHLTPSQ